MGANTAGHIVISTDSHTEALVDLKPYLERKHHAAFDEGIKLAMASFVPGVEGFATMVDLGFVYENQDTPMEMDRPIAVEEYAKPLPMNERLKALDEDGVAAEFITPFVGAYSETMDLDFMHAVTLAFNRFFVDYTSPAPYRFAASTAVNLVGGLDLVLKEIAAAHKHGLPAISLPGKVKEHASPDLPYYNARFWDPMWTALAERNMVAVFHVGLGREKPRLRWNGTEPGWEVMFAIDVSRGHLEALPYILAGGVLERHPGLNVGYVESGTRWVGPMLKELDAFVRAMPSQATTKLEMLPSEQWHRQGFVAGMFERDELDKRHEIGVANLTWGSDFPHVEGSYPHTRAHLARLFAGVPAADRDAILAGNAARIFGFDLAKLAETPAARAPWPIAA